MDNLNCKLTAKHFIIQQSEDNNSCGESHWKAGGNKLKERANADETGLEIAGVGMDLRSGRSICTRETFTDSPITSKLSKKMHPNNVRSFWEDVVCKYWGCAERTGMRMGNMQPALSVMLAKAHSWSCQVPYLWCIVFKFKTYKKTSLYHNQYFSDNSNQVCSRESRIFAVNNQANWNNSNFEEDNIDNIDP